MEYIKATKADAEQIYELVQETIKTVYPRYYPREVVTFFCELHSKENIRRDIECGSVGILKVENQIVGTGSTQDNHITRVYVAPAFQGQGYGSYIMQCLENDISAQYDVAYLDASLPASHLYEMRGYKAIKHEKWNVANGVVLVYEIMEKHLPNAKTSICYEGKYFVPKSNTENGEVDGQTCFAYHQKGNMLWADYSGGEILKGHLIGTVAENGELVFYYQHMNEQRQVRVGLCHSTPRILEDGKIELSEEWQWLNGDKSKGSSIICEK
uniref:GNAT family N-acetyltransferase n=1 Tax=Acetatifactor sp. TaxID=1872090 RepID=UPI00405667AE